MLEFTTSDAVSVLKKSNNLNAALKNFLKTEIRNGDPAGRFIKDLRSLLDTSNIAQLEIFLDRSRPKFDTHLVGIGGYAHAQLVRNIIDKVADKYAEEFNTTYVISGENLTVTNGVRFDTIARESFDLIDSELKAGGFSGSNFLKSVVLVSIFHQAVLKEIIKGLPGGNFPARAGS